MSYKPTRTFSANVGDPSTGAAGPNAIKEDLDKIMKMFDPNATHDDNSTGGISKANLQTSLLASFISIPIGTIVPFGAPTAPSGWLECDGTAVSRTTYAALFSLFGTTYGVGDGLTTFNLPDMRGEFVRGYDHGRGVDSGRAFGSPQDDELKSHTHRYTHRMHGAGEPQNIGWRAFGDLPLQEADTGGTGGNETRPRNVAMLYIVKY